MKILKGNTSSAFIGKYLTPFLFFLFTLSCNTTDPPDKELSLSFEDVSCTEAWIQVSGETGSEVILNRDDKDLH